jgi:hypothetical protein
MDVTALRDHADEMLTVIAADLRTAQTPYQQTEKAKGSAAKGDTVVTAAGKKHGAGRAESGFTVEEMVAEYRVTAACPLQPMPYDTFRPGASSTGRLSEVPERLRPAARTPPHRNAPRLPESVR